MVPWEAGEGVMRGREVMGNILGGEAREIKHGFFCRRCGNRIYTQSSRPINCPKCGSPMVQSF